MTRKDFVAPHRIEVKSCKGCNAPVFWTEIPGTDRRHIFDVKSLAWVNGELRVESHFAHCPKAFEFRKAPKPT